jgi:hypothetical protein
MTNSDPNAGARFADLVAARKAWIDSVLKPWAQRARRADLLLAEPEWLDIAGKVDPAKTLWAWAWGRFPALVHEDLGIDEAAAVTVTLCNGQTVTGYPDARTSQRGKLVLVSADFPRAPTTYGPFSIDDIASVRKAE